MNLEQKSFCFGNPGHIHEILTHCNKSVAIQVVELTAFCHKDPERIWMYIFVTYSLASTLLFIVKRGGGLADHGHLLLPITWQWCPFVFSGSTEGDHQAERTQHLHQHLVMVRPPSARRVKLVGQLIFPSTFYHTLFGVSKKIYHKTGLTHFFFVLSIHR